MVVGTSPYKNGSTNDILVSRLNPNGEFDFTFGTNGFAQFDLGLDDNGQSAFILDNGNILISGYSWQSNKLSFDILKLKSNGSLDTSFGNDGIVTKSIGISERWNVGNVFAVQSDGKMLMVAPYLDTNDFLLIRFNSNGSLDTTFSDDGKVTTDFGSQDAARSIAIQKDGKILVAGWGSDSKIVIARYNNDGSLDTTFDGDGKVIAGIVERENYGLDLMIQEDGKILVSAECATSIGNWWDFGLVRFNPDGSLDSSFAPASNTLDSISKYTEQYSSILLDSNVQVFDTELANLNNYAGSSISLSRDITSNSDDIFSSMRNGGLSSLVTNSYFSVDGITIGRVEQNSNGVLKLFFNENATQSLVNKTLQQIAYSNTSDNPPSLVKINWIFSDGNNALQGSGGELSTIGSSFVMITPINDAPYPISVIERKEAVVGQLFTFTVPSSVFFDPDSSLISYSAGMLNQTGIPPWLIFNNATNTFSGIPKSSDVGSLSLVVYATDNANAKGQAPFSLTVLASDTTPPTISVNASLTKLIADQTSVITFTLSEASTNFTTSDVSISGGTLSNFIGTGTNYTALFTPTVNSNLNGTISILSGVFTDASGNANADGNDSNNLVTFAIDTLRPTIAVSSNKSSLQGGDSAALYFTLSEASTNFVASDIAVNGGTLSNFAGGGTSYSATFTLASNTSANGTIYVANGVFTDVAGNKNADGSESNNSLNFSRLPTVTNETHTLSVIVDKNVLGSNATLLKDLKETITLTNGTITKHSVEYANLTFDYNQIDSLITTVTRDGEFTTEFTKEINEYLKLELNIPYSAAVALVGTTSIDAVILSIAGADGNYVV